MGESEMNNSYSYGEWNGEDEDDDLDEFFDSESIYEYDPDKSKTFGGLVISLVACMLNLATIATIAELAFISPSKAAILTFSDIFGASGVGIGENLAVFLYGIIACNGISFCLSVASALYFTAQRSNEREENYVPDPRKERVMKSEAVALCCAALVSAILGIVATQFVGLVANTVTDTVDLVVEEDSPQKMFDFQIALFNECCFDAGFSEQGEIFQCVGDLVQDCSNIPDIGGFESALCACYDSAPAYNIFVDRIAESDICSRLNEAKVSIGQDTKIPGIPFSISFIITSLYPTAVIPQSGQIPVVGFAQFDASGGDSFGCGIGYAKGFMFIVSLWFEQNLSIALYIIFGIQFATVVLAGVMMLWLSWSAVDADDLYLGENLLPPNKSDESGNTVRVQNAMYRLGEEEVNNGRINAEEQEKGVKPVIHRQEGAPHRKRRKKRRQIFVTGEFLRHVAPTFDEHTPSIKPHQQGETPENEEPLLVRRGHTGRRRGRKKNLVKGKLITG